ncbi:SEL1-like repeat protein [Thioflexithrix psekupsensis]|uniref:Uncharacterized protein n=1 Tax=Thioflexithrix psekupsensis TaxID=1570016 RepID=A0A251XAQ3_9GAMM|nr:tetratricopeptide repeat protein [Thioflexithrix psekupsensis]OUD15512.1 hypothetical protein TPSD3_03040 [Thioflexithrix psekupsensis]
MSDTSKAGNRVSDAVKAALGRSIPSRQLGEIKSGISNGEMKQQVNRWCKLAKKGNAEAQFYLGAAYYKGEGIEQNYSEAVKWFRKAAEQGHVNAQTALGFAYHEGEGIKQNYSEAVKWFRKAAEQGHVNAQTALGFAYHEGEGIKQNYSEAVKWFRKAAEQGHLEAQFNLAVAYYKGEGIEQNYSEAVKWFRKAAEQGHLEAQFNLAAAYYKGEGIEQNYSEAVKWVRKSAEQNLAEAQFNLGVAYDNGEGIEQNYSEAVKWFRKAAEQNLAEAQFNLGVAYHEGKGVKQNYFEAIEWFRKAAEQGEADAQTALGVAYYKGEGIEQNYSEAVKWFRKAAEQGLAKAQFNLGVAYYNGEGIEQNYSEAVKWFRKAAEQGHVNAQTALGVAYYEGEGIEQDESKAIECFNKAAIKESIIAQLYLSFIGESGGWLHRVAANWVAGNKALFEPDDPYDITVLNYLHQQAELENTPAQVILYFLYRDGNGVKADKELALQWLEKAKAKKDPLALYLCALLESKKSQAIQDFQNLIQLLEKDSKITVHFSEFALTDINTEKDDKNKSDYPQNVKQWLALIAHSKLSELKEQQANSELENLMALLAHKMQGSLVTLNYNLESESPAKDSLEVVRQMSGLLKILSIVSADKKVLQQRLSEDQQGEANLFTVLIQACINAFNQILNISGKEYIKQHYIRYGIENDLLPIEILSDKSQLGYNKNYRTVWKKLQKKWYEEWNKTCQTGQFSSMQDWLATHLFPLQIEGIIESRINFKQHEVKYSLLLIILTEFLVNALKYYSSSSREPVKIALTKSDKYYQLRCENPIESEQNDLKGSGKGHDFLNLIALKLNGEFVAHSTEKYYTAQCNFPVNLFASGVNHGDL